MKPNWIEIAEAELGVREKRGGENKRILEYHSKTKLAATEDEVSWCSSFMNWVMDRAKCKRTYSAAARSWLQSDVGTRLNKFKPYCIVVFRRGNSTWQGHVAFGLEETGSSIVCLGGNQSDAVSISKYSKSKVLGYIWPVTK